MPALGNGSGKVIAEGTIVESLFATVLCNLAADNSNDGNALRNHFDFYIQKDKTDPHPLTADELKRTALYKHKLPAFDINSRDPLKRKATEAAAKSGSVSSLEFLINIKKASVIADEDNFNLLYWSLRNDAVRKYLLDPHNKRWRQFNDGTTDFHAAIISGDIEKVTAMFAENNDVICEYNLKKQTAFYWADQLSVTNLKEKTANYQAYLTAKTEYDLKLKAHATAVRLQPLSEEETATFQQENLIRENKLKELEALCYTDLQMQALLEKLGNQYIALNSLNQQWEKLGNYYAALGHYYAANPENIHHARTAFNSSMRYYLKSNHYTQQGEIELSCGNLLLEIAKKTGGEGSVTTYQESIQYYQNALENLLTTPPTKELANLQKTVENILRKMANAFDGLHEIYMMRGDAAMRANNTVKAIESGYVLALEAGEKAYHALTTISVKLSEDTKSMTDCCNKLVLCSGLLKQLTTELADLQTIDDLSEIKNLDLTGNMQLQKINSAREYYKVLSNQYLEKRNFYLSNDQGNHASANVIPPRVATNFAASDNTRITIDIASNNANEKSIRISGITNLSASIYRIFANPDKEKANTQKTKSKSSAVVPVSFTTSASIANFYSALFNSARGKNGTAADAYHAITPTKGFA